MTNGSSGLYYEYHIPLGLKEMVEQLSVNQSSSRNVPVLTGSAVNREWFSQPRPANAMRHERITIFEVHRGRTGGFVWNPPWVPTYDTTVFAKLDGSTFDWRGVEYPANLPLHLSLDTGVAALIRAINTTPGKFILTAMGLDAIVASRVYDEIRYGSLQSRRPDLVGGLMFGNPCRQAGHTFPGCTYTHGHGVLPPEERLANCEELWWEFVEPGDHMADVDENTSLGNLLRSIFYSWRFDFLGIVEAIIDLFVGWPFNIPTYVYWYHDSFFSNHDDRAPRLIYSSYRPLDGNNRTCVDLAIDQCNEIADSTPLAVYNQPITEVVSAFFKLPLSVSEIGFETLRVPVTIECWYQDRQNNWRQMLDMQRMPVRLNIALSNSAAWYKFHSFVYPIVAKAVQLRLTRIVDPLIGVRPYVVGLKNTLIRRNVYDRSQGRLPFEDEQDPMGNVITKYIRDWDGVKAIDDKPATFWRSAPMPDPNAVVSLYLDIRAPDGSPQLIDKVYIDPVYTGQALNLYYSNDDAETGRRLSPVTLSPDTDINTEWRSGRGRWDSSADPGTSSYFFPAAWGPMVSKDTWIGIEWLPDFDPLNGPPDNPKLFTVVPDDPHPTQWWPTIFYDVGSGEIVLEFTNDNDDTRSYRTALSPLLTTNESLRIVVGWSYAPDTVIISVKDRNGSPLTDLSDAVNDLPSLVTLDGQVGFENFRGTFSAHVVKLENVVGQGEAFQANPAMYVSPDPVVPDPDGVIPSTSLDNALYAADWIGQEHGTGGNHESVYAGKVWTPIWRNYFSQKGKMRLPAATKMRYLKLEFTGLTEESYPVFDTDIKVQYKVFPISVIQQAQTKRRSIRGGSLVGTGVGGLIGAVNWLQPSTVLAALNPVYGRTASPIQVTVGPGITTGAIPTNTAEAISTTQRQEQSSPLIYRRGLMLPTTLANHYLATSTKSQEVVQGIVSSAGMTMDDLGSAFASTPPPTTTPTVGPVIGRDWWIFPGGNLRLPSSVMNTLTRFTQVKLDRKPSSSNRPRFITASVHRYDIKTVTRDAAVAYFAGVREVTALSTSYIAEEDPTTFNFDVYDDTQWVLTNTRSLDTGPVSTQGRLYSIPNPDFDLGIGEWEVVSGDYDWDSNNFNGHWHPGCLLLIADGTRTTILSDQVVAVGADSDLVAGHNITFSVWVRWDDLMVNGSDPVIELGLVSYLDDEVIDDTIVLDAIADTSGASGDPGANVYAQLSGGWEVPEGVNHIRIRLGTNAAATSGEIRFDLVLIQTGDEIEATVFKEFQTTSTFAEVRCDFRDSGAVRSNDMWARADPLDTNIDASALAYYTTVTDVPSGTWADTFATWADPQTAWGAIHPLVNVNVDPNRIFQGRRVLHFTRDPGAGEAGVLIRQWTNFVSDGLARVCARWYKTGRNDNTVTMRLRRSSDGVYVYETVVTAPAVGQWYDFASEWFEIPEDTDHVYTLEFVLQGDDEEDMYLADAWTEICHGRYFARLGGSNAFLHDVTALRYSDGAIVSVTDPVNEFSVECVILSPKFWCYGATFQPAYLQ